MSDFMNGGHWPDEDPRIRGRLVPVAAAIGMLVLGIFGIVCVGGLLGALIIISRHGLEGAAAGVQAVTGDAMAVTFFGGFGAFALVGSGIALGLGWRPRHVFALRAGGWGPVLAAGFGGLIVGFLPGYIATLIMESFPYLADSGSLNLIGTLLTEGSLLDRALVVLTITVGAPFLEEVCFRGLLWNASERMLPRQQGQALAFALTSFAFVVAHADPVQSPALIPTALFFGWLRWTSGSIWPCMLAHFVNNTLATVITFIAVAYEIEDDGSSALWMALIGAVLTLAACGLAYFGRRRPSATPEDARDHAPPPTPKTHVPYPMMD